MNENYSKEESDYFNALDDVVGDIRYKYRDSGKHGPKLMACAIHRFVRHNLDGYHADLIRYESESYISFSVSIKRDDDLYETDYYYFDNFHPTIEEEFSKTYETFENLKEDAMKEDGSSCREINEIVRYIEKNLKLEL
jgi:hypothetical protein